MKFQKLNYLEKHTVKYSTSWLHVHLKFPHFFKFLKQMLGCQKKKTLNQGSSVIHLSITSHFYADIEHLPVCCLI